MGSRYPTLTVLPDIYDKVVEMTQKYGIAKAHVIYILLSRAEITQEEVEEFRKNFAPRLHSNPSPYTCGHCGERGHNARTCVVDLEARKLEVTEQVMKNLGITMIKNPCSRKGCKRGPAVHESHT